MNFSNEAFKSDSCVWMAFMVATNDLSDSVLGFSPVTLCVTDVILYGSRILNFSA